MAIELAIAQRRSRRRRVRRVALACGIERPLGHYSEVAMSSDPSHPTVPSAPQTGRPFEGEPRDVHTPRQGCSRMALAGCAAVLLLLGLGVLSLMLKGREVVSWSLGRVRIEIVDTLPEDLPRSQRERLGLAFDAAQRRLESGDLDPVAFQELQAQLLRFAGLGRPPTHEEVGELSSALERFAGTDRPVAEPDAPSSIEPVGPALF